MPRPLVRPSPALKFLPVCILRTPLSSAALSAEGVVRGRYRLEPRSTLFGGKIVPKGRVWVVHTDELVILGVCQSAPSPGGGTSGKCGEL